VSLGLVFRFSAVVQMCYMSSTTSAIYCSTLYLINGHSGGVTHAKTMLSAVLVLRPAAWLCTNTPFLCMLVK